MLGDDELAEIRRRKMELMMKRAKEAQQPKPQVLEPTANGTVTILTEANFWQAIQQTKTALVDFFGEWCGPCKTLAPILAELASEYKSRVYFAKVDIDRNRRLAGQFGVQSVPNVFAFKNGRVVNNLAGVRSWNEYDAWIRRLLE